MARRGRGEGTISQRADGRWQVRVPLGRDETTGRRKRKYRYADTQAEAVRLLKQLSGQAVEGELRVTSTPLVGQFLDEWHARNREGWKPSTARSYRIAIDMHLKPAFGRLRLEQLSPQQVQRWMTGQADEHGARRRIALARATLRSALSEALALDLIARNPAAGRFKVPKSVKRRIQPLDSGEASALLAAAHAHRLGPLLITALTCGLRLGEATGLAWWAVDLETGELQVTQQVQAVSLPRTEPSSRGRHRRALAVQGLKTEKSRRNLVLPHVSRAALEEHRRQQLKERLKAGARWSNPHQLVFTTRWGGPLDPRNVLRAFYAVLTAAGITPRRRFHDLRHSAAALLIAQGVPLVEVSLLLGHSEIRTTADFYGHLAKQTASRAAMKMDALLGTNP